MPCKKRKIKVKERTAFWPCGSCRLNCKVERLYCQGCQQYFHPVCEQIASDDISWFTQLAYKCNSCFTSDFGGTYNYGHGLLRLKEVVRKDTGEPPILLGPLFLHWDGKQQNYFRFFSHLRGILDLDLHNFEILMGSDDEKAMTNAIDLAFPGAERKLCSKHIKDNIIRQMTEKIPKNTKERNEIVQMIFGENGVARADDSTMFDDRNSQLKEKLLENQHEDFLHYYTKHMQAKISDHVVSKGDQLWTNNNTESVNHRLKVLLPWKPQKTDELVDKLYELVQVQMVGDLRRALYGTGKYVLNNKFQKLKVSKISWCSKTEEEKKKLLAKFLKAGKLTEQATITSSDGTYTVHKIPRLAKSNK